ncbi:adenosine deaminase [Corallococcus sp. H22C18031201]|nr:adenosine deaminase [Citreicoccus inhibens]RJS24022.1 adenosine deaminase [Corallococcus sp. H22C18031201]
MVKALHWGVCVALLAVGCSDEPTSPPPAEASREERVGQKLESLRNQPAPLRDFLVQLPKGADLHNHLSGAVTMENLIQWGTEDGVCVNTTTWVAAAPPCAAGALSMVNTQTDATFKRNILEAWSMEGFQGTLLEGHQHFFDAFGKFGAVLSEPRTDDSIADVLNTAGRNHQIYVELLQGLSSSTVGKLAAKYIQPGDPWDEAYLLKKRGELLADPVFTATMEATQASITKSITGARDLLKCGTAAAEPGCDVATRFVLSANRTQDRGYVFAQWVYAYELAQVSPEVVGINLVSPEENDNSLKFYDDEMFALDVLRRFNQRTANRRTVHISLHAGELIPAVLPTTPEGQRQLSFHIRHAVEIAHAERIGHGADVLDETAGDGAEDLLWDMNGLDVMVEICLSSNSILLGKSGAAHPLKSYLGHGVPVALSTDDQGIFRTNITDEYVRAVSDQGLDYRTLKAMVRTSLEHAFLPGASLWKTRSQYDGRVEACAQDTPGPNAPSANCAALLASSERAALQWKLESQLAAFEEAVLK